MKTLGRPARPLPASGGQGRAAALHHFATLIRRYRDQCGYATARAFYQAMGAGEYFGCTYKAYLNLENGVSVPSPALVERVAAGLRIALHEAWAREFALAYLRILIGWDEFYEFAVQTLADQGPAPDKTQREALTHSIEERMIQLDQGQSDLLLKSSGHYWVFSVLANDRGRWDAADVAQLLGLEQGEVRAVLQDLSKAGFAVKDKVGKWYCPKAGKVFAHPKDDPFNPSHLRYQRRYWDDMARDHGAVLMEHPLLTRASEAELRHYFPYLIQSVMSADIYSTKEQGADTAFFLIEATAQKLLPF